uniref:Uncharacterized protein n=1 Tax=Anguilla anguilla TaxID=7936 RepID=A0A0E9V7V0_ANGAN
MSILHKKPLELTSGPVWLLH